MIEVADFESPIGTLRLGATGGRLCWVGFEEDGMPPASLRSGGSGERSEAPHDRAHQATRRVDDPAGAVTALSRYFGGELDALDGLALELHGSAFQRRAWAAMRAIGPGATASYTEVAACTGSPRAVRAVGTAAGANLIPVVIPCHRVVRSDGTLGGYGGGLDRKRWLLAHEGVKA